MPHILSGFTPSFTKTLMSSYLHDAPGTEDTAVNGTDERLIYEGSDMFYHLIVLLTSKGLRIEDVARELALRHDPNWDKQRREAKSKGEMK